MSFRTGTPQWMKLSQLRIREDERQRQKEQDIIRMEKLKKEQIRRAFQKRRNPLGYWENINGWRFIRW